jgi:hypothetical protein
MFALRIAQLSSNLAADAGHHLWGVAPEEATPFSCLE